MTLIDFYNQNYFFQERPGLAESITELIQLGFPAPELTWFNEIKYKTKNYVVSLGRVGNHYYISSLFCSTNLTNYSALPDLESFLGFLRYAWKKINGSLSALQDLENQVRKL